MRGRRGLPGCCHTPGAGQRRAGLGGLPVAGLSALISGSSSGPVLASTLSRHHRVSSSSRVWFTDLYAPGCYTRPSACPGDAAPCRGASSEGAGWGGQVPSLRRAAEACRRQGCWVPGSGAPLTLCVCVCVCVAYTHTQISREQTTILSVQSLHIIFYSLLTALQPCPQWRAEHTSFSLFIL